MWCKHADGDLRVGMRNDGRGVKNVCVRCVVRRMGVGEGEGARVKDCGAPAIKAAVSRIVSNSTVLANIWPDCSVSEGVSSVSVVIVTLELNLTIFPIFSPEIVIVIVVDVTNVSPLIVMSRDVSPGCPTTRVWLPTTTPAVGVGVTVTSKKPDG